MDKILKNIINNTIEREYDQVSANLINIMKKSPQLVKDYDKYGEQKEKIMNKLLEVVPEEYLGLIDEFEAISNVLIGVEARAAFKEGIVLGVTELSYLSEVGIEIAFV